MLVERLSCYPSLGRFMPVQVPLHGPVPLPDVRSARGTASRKRNSEGQHCGRTRRGRVAAVLAADADDVQVRLRYQQRSGSGGAPFCGPNRAEQVRLEDLVVRCQNAAHVITGSHHKVIWVRSLVPKEKNSASVATSPAVTAARGVSIIVPTIYFIFRPDCSSQLVGLGAR